MKKYLFSIASVATLLLVGTNAHAQPIIWSYVAADTKVDNSTPVSAATSTIAFTGQSYGSVNNSGIVIYKLATSSTASEGAPDSITDASFTLGITFVDTKAGADAVSGTKKVSDTVFFTGKLSASNISKSTFSFDALSWSTPLVQKITLGGSDPTDGWREYTITVPSWSFSPPGVPNGPDGSIYVDVKVGPGEGPGGSGDGGGTPGATPEPTSLVLAGLGLPLFVFMRRRLKKAPLETTVA